MEKINLVMKKVCIRCNREKELIEFNKIKKSIDGHRNQCRTCLNELAKIRSDNLSEEEKERRRMKKNKRSREFFKNNIDNYEFRSRQKKKRKDYHLNKLETDELYKIKISYSRRLNKYLKRGRVDKSKNAPYFLDKLGCSFEEFKLYLESKFEKWMNWNNYGKYNGEINYVGILTILYHYQMLKAKKIFINYHIIQIFNHCVVSLIEI